MPDHLSRRAVLAGIGTAVLAGCTTERERAPEADPGETGSSTPTPTPTPVGSTSAGDDGPATSDDPTATDTATPHHDTTTSPGPVPEPPVSVDSEWPVPAADAGRSNHAAGAAGPAERVTELWRLVADTTFSTPVLAAETVFVGGEDGSVRALDARSGAERWQQSVGASAGAGDGAPWAVGDRLFVPTTGAIAALDRDDGTESWRVETPDRAAVLVTSRGVYWIDAGGPAVVALAPDDGTERWRTAIGDPWEPPLFAGGESVFVSSGTNDVRFWTMAADTGDRRGKAPRNGADFPAEQCYTDGTVYAVDAFFGNVRATPVTDGGEGWSQGVPPGGEAGGGLVSVGDDRVYYTSNADGPGLAALSKTDGTVAWTADVPAVVTGRPVVAGEAVLVPTDGGVRCFDPADGSERWTHPGFGSRLVVADDLVYASGEGMVRAFRPP